MTTGEDGIVFFSLILIGSGRHSLERTLFSRQTDASRYTLP